MQRQSKDFVALHKHLFANLFDQGSYPVLSYLGMRSGAGYGRLYLQSILDCIKRPFKRPAAT